MTTYAPNPLTTLPGDPAASAPSRPAARLQSLDALRGVTIALMILVNTSGDARHTFPLASSFSLEGCTIADVVFPCFLFMVGISLVLSFTAKLRRGVPRRVLVLQALRRALILFALGSAINGFPLFHLHTLRVFGVLQRIAICFLLASLIYVWLHLQAALQKQDGCSSLELFVCLQACYGAIGCHSTNVFGPAPLRSSTLELAWPH